MESKLRAGSVWEVAGTKVGRMFTLDDEVVNRILRRDLELTIDLGAFEMIDLATMFRLYRPASCYMLASINLRGWT